MFGVVGQVNEPYRRAVFPVGVANLTVEAVVVHNGLGRFVEARTVAALCAADACPWAKAAVGDLSIEQPEQRRQGKAEGYFGRLQ